VRWPFPRPLQWSDRSAVGSTTGRGPSSALGAFGVDSTSIRRIAAAHESGLVVERRSADGPHGARSDERAPWLA